MQQKTNDTTNLASQSRSQMLFLYCLSYIPKLRKMPRDEVKRIGQEASDISSVNELIHIKEPRFEIKPFGKITGGQAQALMISALWVLVGEDKDMAAPLVELYKWLPTITEKTIST